MISVHVLLSVLGGVALLFSACWREWRQRRAADVLLAARGAVLVSHRLLDLLRHLQQHRGMSCAWLAGDAEFEARMRHKRAEIEAVLGALEDVPELGAREPWGARRAELAAFRERWRLVSQSVATHSVDRNFAQHSCLIEVVLNWLAALGERYVERSARALGCGDEATNFTHHLPMLSECLAQARGIGASVAARSGCSPVARVRLMFLIGKAESLLRRIGTADRGAGDLARHAVSTMAQMVRRSMLMSSGVGVSTDVYFMMSSRGIDAVLDWARSCGAEMEARLAQSPVMPPWRLFFMRGS